jgi:hypothetical protein
MRILEDDEIIRPRVSPFGEPEHSHPADDLQHNPKSGRRFLGKIMLKQG